MNERLDERMGKCAEMINRSVKKVKAPVVLIGEEKKFYYR